MEFSQTFKQNCFKLIDAQHQKYIRLVQCVHGDSDEVSKSQIISARGAFLYERRFLSVHVLKIRKIMYQMIHVKHLAMHAFEKKMHESGKKCMHLGKNA